MFVVVWTGPDADFTGIYARVYDSAGDPVTGEIAVNATTANEQRDPEVGIKDDGKFIVAWRSTNAGTFNDIIVRKFESNGTVPTGEFNVASTPAGAQYAHSLAMKGDGDFVVTHSIARGWGPSPMVVFDIFLVRGGKIREHWDVMQPVMDKTMSGLSQTDGDTEVVETDKTAQNRALVQGFFDEVLYGGTGSPITSTRRSTCSTTRGLATASTGLARRWQSSPRPGSRCDTRRPTG